MTQSLISSRYPYLHLHLRVGQADWHGEALLDTGFDGDVVLPLRAVSTQEAPEGHLRWRLADGSVVLAPYYLGTAELNGRGPMRVVITALGDEPLLGRGILARFRVVLDHGREIRLDD